MKELHHPHVVQFLGFTNPPSIGKLFIVMEYMPLGSVEDYLSQHPKTTLATRVRWCNHMARALAYLHNRKPNFLIHRTYSFFTHDKLSVSDNMLSTYKGLTKFATELSFMNRWHQTHELHAHAKFTLQAGGFRHQPAVQHAVDAHCFAIVTQTKSSCCQ